MDDALRGQLLPGERVLWEGRPASGIILRPIEIFLIPFSLLWGGFALFWNISVWTMGADDIVFKLFGLPFLVAGVYVILGRFMADMYVRRRQLYAVTDRRVLILKRSWGRATTKSVDIQHLPALELEERSDGSGTIRFGPAASWLNHQNFGIWQPSADPTPQFIRIPDVRRIYALIERQMAIASRD